MSVPAVVDAEAFELISQVAERTVLGKKPMAIAKELNVPFRQVKEAIAQWHEMMRADNESRDVARDYLNRMVAHYDDLIAKSYANLSNLESMSFDEKVSAQINTTLKNISEFESRRVDALQKAGLLDAHDLGDELAEREEREAMIIDILRNDLCPDCQRSVRDKLTRLTGVVQGAVVEDV